MVSKCSELLSDPTEKGRIRVCTVQSRVTAPVTRKPAAGQRKPIKFSDDEESEAEKSEAEKSEDESMAGSEADNEVDAPAITDDEADEVGAGKLLLVCSIYLCLRGLSVLVSSDKCHHASLSCA